jgi:hypothetical protein
MPSPAGVVPPGRMPGALNVDPRVVLATRFISPARKRPRIAAFGARAAYHHKSEPHFGDDRTRSSKDESLTIEFTTGTVVNVREGLQRHGSLTSASANRRPSREDEHLEVLMSG